MKHTLRQIFHSGRFLAGFSIFAALLLIVLIYPLFVRDSPLTIIGQGTFFPPGIYVNTFDSINAPTTYTLMLDNAAAKRIANKLSNDDRLAMKEWLVSDGIPATQIDTSDIVSLLDLWQKNYDPTKSFSGMTYAKQRYYQRVNTSLQGILSTESYVIAAQNQDTGALEQTGDVKQ
jgi:peptide/nickel transport system permease protein